MGFVYMVESYPPFSVVNHLHYITHFRILHITFPCVSTHKRPDVNFLFAYSVPDFCTQICISLFGSLWSMFKCSNLLFLLCWCRDFFEREVSCTAILFGCFSHMATINFLNYHPSICHVFLSENVRSLTCVHAPSSLSMAFLGKETKFQSHS